MALSLRRKPTKVQRVRHVASTVVALRLFGIRRLMAVAGLGALTAVALIARRRSGGGSQPVPGAPPTAASAPVPEPTGTATLQDAAEQARSAAASLTPHGNGA